MKSGTHELEYKYRENQRYCKTPGHIYVYLKLPSERVEESLNGNNSEFSAKDLNLKDVRDFILESGE